MKVNEPDLIINGKRGLFEVWGLEAGQELPAGAEPFDTKAGFIIAVRLRKGDGDERVSSRGRAQEGDEEREWFISPNGGGERTLLS